MTFFRTPPIALSHRFLKLFAWHNIPLALIPQFKYHDLESPKSLLAVLKRAGIEDFRWHDLHHTWATWQRQAGHRPMSYGAWVGGELGRW